MAKADEAHLLTEKELAKLEKRIAKLYRDAAKEMQATINDYFSSFEKRDKEMQALIGSTVNGKEWTKENYKQWRLNQIGRGKHMEALRDKLAERVTQANETAVAYTNDTTPGIYSLNRNYTAYTIEQVSDAADFTLWDEQTVKRLAVERPDLMPYYPKKQALKRGIDLEYGKKQITASITSSILQGKSIKGIADDLQGRITTMSRASAIRTARTAVTGAQNAGRMDSYAAAEKMGIKLKKEWLATLDGRTRHSHAMLDGEQVAQDAKFSNGCRFPGDPQGPPWEVYNCRCTLIAAVDGVDTSDAQRWARDPETGERKLVSDMSYQEWAGWKEKEQKTVANSGQSGTIKAQFRESDFRSFDTGDEVNDFFYYDSEKRGLLAKKNSYHGKWTSALEQEQRIAIGEYCADGYADINNYWRQYGDWEHISKDKVLNQTRLLDKAIADYDLKESIKVYRAVQPEAFEDYWDDIQKLVGTTYTDPAFMSTSPFRGSDAVNKDCIMELFIPAGKGRGAYINNLSGFQDSEYEFLLARDSRFRVISAEETETQLILKMELITDDERTD